MINMRKKYLLFIKNSLVSLFSVSLILLIIWLYLSNFVFPSMKENIYDSIKDQLNIISQDTVEDFRFAEEYLKNISREVSPHIMKPDYNMGEILSTNLGIFDHFSVFDVNERRLYTYPSNGGDQRFHSEINKTLSSGETKVSNIYEKELSNEFVFSVFVPIYLDGQIKGVLKGSLNIMKSSLNPSIGNIKLRESGLLFLLNKEGEILIHGDKEVIGTNVKDQFDAICIETILSAEDMTIGIFEKEGKQDKIIGFSKIYKDLIVGISYEYRELFAPILRLKNGFAFLSLFLFSLVGIFIYYYNRKIHEPVLKVVEYAEKISNGEFGYALPKENRGEISYIISALNKVLKDRDSLLEQIIDSLVITMEKKDTYTAGHSHRVKRYAVAIAKKMQLSDKEIKTLTIGALLHDIGKIGISDEVLLKPGKLTDDEFEKIKLHTIFGYEIIKEVKNLKDALPIIRSHHERFDGRGYPDQLSGNDISLLARITCVADAFDAMTSNRAYRNKMSFEKARDIIRDGSGEQFDPIVVEAFLQCFYEGGFQEEQNIIVGKIS